MHPISKQGSTRKRNSPPHTAKFCMLQPAAGGAQQSRPSLPQAELNIPQPAAGGAQHTTARRRRSSACLRPPQAELSTPRGAPHATRSSARLSPPQAELSTPQHAAGGAQKIARLSPTQAPLSARQPAAGAALRTFPPAAGAALRAHGPAASIALRSPTRHSSPACKPAAGDAGRRR